ncbi:unnamed protein product, partial [Brenthis ino]
MSEIATKSSPNKTTRKTPQPADDEPKSPVRITKARKQQKRKREGLNEDDECYGLMDEMKKLFDDFKCQQNKKLELLQSSINSIKQQNDDFRATLEFISMQYDDIKTKVDSLELDKKTHLAHIQSLETKIENLEKNQNISAVVIRNVPHKSGEKKEHLQNLIEKTGTLLNITVGNSDIRNIYRINSSKNNNSTIIVDFSTVTMKDRFLGAFKNYNKTNKKNKFNTNLLKLDGPEKPIYVSEHLTFKCRKLFSLTRDFATKNSYKYCWTTNGRIYLRKTEGSRHIRIDSECDLDKLSEQL